MAKKRVSTTNGKLYRISIYNGKYSVSEVDVHIPFNKYYSIGETRSLEDALSLIRSHAGAEIRRITDW